MCVKKGCTHKIRSSAGRRYVLAEFGLFPRALVECGSSGSASID